LEKLKESREVFFLKYPIAKQTLCMPSLNLARFAC